MLTDPYSYKTKTRVLNSREEGFEFLGFAFRWQRSQKGGDYVHVEPSAKSRMRLRARIRELTPRSTTWKATNTVVNEVNAVVRGWGNYFAFGHYGEVFKQMRRFTSHRLVKEIPVAVAVPAAPPETLRDILPKDRLFCNVDCHEHGPRDPRRDGQTDA